MKKSPSHPIIRICAAFLSLLVFINPPTPLGRMAFLFGNEIHPVDVGRLLAYQGIIIAGAYLTMTVIDWFLSVEEAQLKARSEH